MRLPPELLQAISATGGGKVTLVVGAGCSFEPPTSIPLAGTCAQECHDRLVANGVLGDGECPAPGNLSLLADAVFTKTGKQRPLVDELSQHYAFKAASPNEGHLLAAALLGEGAIASVLTLNFDLALSTAIGVLGVGDAVGIIDGPDDFPNQKAVNLYYLHRNVTEADPEKWVLRTAALATEWTGRWDSVVVAKVLSTPVVVFAGLGSPADVLVASTKLIQKAIPQGNKWYLVDPVDHAHSEFFKALALEPSAYVPATWCDFMATLSERLVVAQTTAISAAAHKIVDRENLTPEDLTALLGRLQEIGLVRLGRLRARWLLHEKPYLRDERLARELVADLLLAAALITRVTGAIAVPDEDGVVQFRRGDRTVASMVFVSGHGTRSLVAIEGELSTRKRHFRGLATPPTGAIVAGLSDNAAAPIAAPLDVVLGDTSKNILFGPSTMPIVHVQSLRHDPKKAMSVAP